MSKTSKPVWGKSRETSGETKLACKSGGKLDLQSCGDKMWPTFKEDRLYKALGNFEPQSGSAAVPTMCIKYKN